MAISVSAMMGSGIFVLPGLAAAKTGPSVWLAYVLAGICVLPAALSKAELATAMPTSGGTYVFIERTFGPLFGTISGLGIWLSLLLKSAFALVGFSAYLQVLGHVVGQQFPLKTTALFLLGIIVFLNVIGIRRVGQTQLAIVVIGLLGLGILLAGGIFCIDAGNLEPAFTGGSGGFLAATGFVFVSYAGVTEIAAIAEEIKEPNRNLPLGMLLSLAIVTLLYGSVVFVLVGNVPVSDLTGDLKPIYTLAHKLLGAAGGAVAAVLGVMTMTSMANAGLLAASRFPFAMSRDKLLPGFLYRLHKSFMTPVSCIMLTGVFMGFAILAFDIEKIAKLASAFLVLMFIAVNLCVVVLRETSVQWYKPGYRCPLYPSVQVVGVVSGVVLFALLGKEALWATAVVVLVGTVVFLPCGKGAGVRKGVVRLYGRRAMALLFSPERRAAHANEWKSGSWSFNRLNLRESPRDQAEIFGGREAQVVVPLFGNERSPEMLVEVGAALAGGRKVEVVHITELPFQTILDADLQKASILESLSRRLSAMSEEEKIDLDFDEVVTHDLVETVHSISDRMHCEFLVMGWAGRVGLGLLVRNPIGWLITHLSCNLALFKDAGVRYIRKILVHADTGGHGELVAGVADHLAQIYGAELTFIQVVPEGDSDGCGVEIAEAVQDLRSRCVSVSDLTRVESMDVVSAVVKASVGYDLLVTGAPMEGKLVEIILGTGKDRLTEGAACSVLRLTSPRQEKTGRIIPT